MAASFSLARSCMPWIKSVWKLLSKLTMLTPILAAKALVDMVATSAVDTLAANTVDFKAASAVEMRSFFTGFLPLDLECRLTPFLNAGPFGLLGCAPTWRQRL